MSVDVSHIVREVIAELERRQRADARSGNASSPTTPNPTPAPPTPAAPCPTPPPSDARELAICSRVVTFDQIRDRLAHIRRLIVSPGAVITPAVRDALADRNIAIVFDAANTAAATTAATPSRLVLVAARTTYDTASLAAALRAEGVGVENQASTCLIRTVDALADRVRDGATLAAVLTHDVAAALCLANRLPGIRAVSAADPATVVEAARAVGANVLVIDPRGRGVFQLKQLLSAFCRGPWPCPEVLRPRLG